MAYSQIWLNLLVVIPQFGYITKLKTTHPKKKKKKKKKTLQIIMSGPTFWRNSFFFFSKSESPNFATAFA
jgi:hypothetical protein